ncbi:MAG: hypothetical protein FD130_1587, partial [Halothiobacillaceae bacterium]
ALAALEALLLKGADNPLLRFSLGNGYFNRGDYSAALPHLIQAVALDPGYSAAWKLYGKTLVALARQPEAEQIYTQGIRAAEQKGDLQAKREMEIFLKRLQKSSAST